MARFLALDLDPAGLLVAAGNVHAGKAVVERTLVWEDAQLPLTPLNATALGERFKEALKAAGIPGAAVLVGVGRDRVILKELRYPPVPDVEEPAIVRFQAMKELTESPDDVVLDYVPQAVVGGEKRAMAFVLPKDLLQAIQAFVAAAGLKLAGVTPRPFAVAAALRRAFHNGLATSPDRPDDAVAVVHLGRHGGEFTVLRGSAVTFTRTLSAAAAVDASVLAGELKRNLVVYNGQHALHPLAALYVAEVEGANRVAALRSALAVPVQAFDPLADAATPVPADAVGRFVGTVGLLALKAGPELPINFVTPRQPKPVADPNRKLVLLTALACVLLLGVGAVYGFLQLSRAEHELASAATQKRNAEELLTQLEVDSKRLTAVDDWKKREVVWLDEMYDLFERFPNIEQARVTALTGTALPLDKKGQQPAQAKMELKLASRTPDAVSALVTAFDRENVERNKYYVNPTKIAGGLASGSAAGPFNLLFTLSTLVKNRLPSEYVRQSSASPEPKADTAAETATSASTAPARTTTAPPPVTRSSSGFRPAPLNDPWFNP